MTYFTPAEIAAIAQQAGFTGQGLEMAVAIAEAESGGYSDAININKGGSEDRGLWQINNYFHSEISDAAAFNPQEAAAAAYKISGGGASWTQWSTYENGRYKQFLSEAEQAVTPWYGYKVTQPFGVNGEQGIDIGTPFHTPVSMLYPGTVHDASYQPWGGQVIVDTMIPGVGQVQEYMIHLDEISPDIKPGAQIAAGQYIGLSGGENPGFPGAEHPADPKFSSGLHVEWGIKDGSGHPIDPTSYVQGAKMGVAGLPLLNTSGGTANPTNTPLGANIDVSGICDALPNPVMKWLCQQGVSIGTNAGTSIADAGQAVVAAIEDVGLRILVGIGGAVLVVVGLGVIGGQLARPQLEQAGKIAEKVIPV